MKNPNLPDYFEMGDEDRSYVNDYEAAKVVVFPGQAAGLDHEFWSSLDVESESALRKLRTSVDLDDPADVSKMSLALRKAGLDPAINDKLCEQASLTFQTLLPRYLAAFDGYRLTSSKAVFRLTTVRSENMHFDLYNEPSKIHFARMFVNLDNQPRIWHTSWPAKDAVETFGDRLDADLRRDADANALWSALTTNVFGKTSMEWWDDQPRHIAFFDPGDAWIVDSRQIAHQIFYGRRALSLDFAVDPETMRDPSSHYLEIAERLRTGTDHAH